MILLNSTFSVFFDRFNIIRWNRICVCLLIVLATNSNLANAESPPDQLATEPTSNSGTEPPPTLTDEQIEQLIAYGDRLADQHQYQEAVEKYTQAYMSVVAKLRGQSFKKLVVPKLMNREELAKEMTEQFKTEMTPDELMLMEATYKVFGLAPESLNIEQTMIKMYTEEVGGFYDPRTKAMVLIHDDPKTRKSEKPKGIFDWFSKADATFDKEEQKTTLAHELTHALQDQLYDLQSQTDLVSHDDDMMLAYSSLVEGDATLVMFVDMGREDGTSDDLLQMDPQVASAMFGMMKLTLPMASGSAYRTAPKIFRESLLFPYMNGMAFTINLTRRGRFQQVDRAFVAPPVSTEQILHPEKFLIQPDQPVAITHSAPETFLGSEWKHLGGNCLGEFQIGVMFADVDSERMASTGWDGDRFEVYQSADLSRAVVWASVWDSNTDAQDFASTYQKYIDRKVRQLSEVKGKANEVPSTSNDDLANRWKVLIKQVDDRVVIVQGVDSDIAELVIQKAIEFTTEEKTFPLPKATLHKVNK